jgi:hypothetical protein
MDDRDRIMMENANNIHVDSAKKLISVAVDVLVLKGAVTGKKMLGEAGMKVGKKSVELIPTSGQELKKTVIIDGKNVKTASAAGKTATNATWKMAEKETIGKKIGTAEATGRKVKTNNKKINLKKSMLLNASKKLIKEEIITDATSRVAKEGGVSEEVGTLMKTRKFLGRLQSGRTLTLSHEGGFDADKLVNSVSGMLLGNPNKTHGGLSASKWLTKDAPREHLIEVGEQAKEKLPDVEKSIKESLDKNKKILEDKKIEVPENLNDKKAQDAFMKRKDLPEEILKDESWIKNREEYLSLRKEEEGLLRKIDIGERPAIDIEEEIGKIDKKTIEQRAMLDQMKTISVVNGTDDLLKGKSIPEIMSNEFVESMDMAHPEDAYKLVADFNKLEEEKKTIASNCQEQLNEGINYLTYAQEKTTKSLLKDAKKILSSAHYDATSDGDEEDIRRMRKA